MLDAHQVIAIVIGVISIFAIFSNRIQGTPITLPIVFTFFGWLISQSNLVHIPAHVEHTVIHLMAEITLILVLFSDAAQVKFRQLNTHIGIPIRMLLIGMPLTMFLGSLVALWVSPEAHWSVVLLVAAILTPTDAALGQTVVTSKAVPGPLRRGINVESGLNDGLALPVVMVAAMASATASGVAVDGLPDSVAVFALMQVTLGPLAGIVVGFCMSRLLDAAINNKYITTSFQGIYFLACAILCFLIAEIIGGNGLIAAFIGGMVFGNSLKSSSAFISEFMESEGQILTMFTFLLFGAVMVPEGLAHASVKTVVLAMLYLTVVRMLPIWISLTGTGLRSYEKIFLGWFGPRGLASILFALLVLDRFEIPGREEIMACVVLTVILSIILHGVTASPMANHFKKLDPQEEK